MEHICPVAGCQNKLDHDGWPLNYCDYQQGKCPCQKRREPLSWKNKADRYLVFITGTCILLIIGGVVLVGMIP